MAKLHPKMKKEISKLEDLLSLHGVSEDDYEIGFSQTSTTSKPRHKKEDLCLRMVANNKKVIEELKSKGWTLERYYENDGNLSFYASDEFEDNECFYHWQEKGDLIKIARFKKNIIDEIVSE